MSRPLPPHGSTARAYGSPGRRARCHCDPCRSARNRHQKQLRVNRQLGRSSFTDPEPARTRLHELHTTMSWRTLVSATDLKLSALVNIYNGRRSKIRLETHAKIMAVTPPTEGDGGQYIDVTGTARRLQALSCLGHSYAVLADEAGSATNRILSIVNGRQPTIRRDLAKRIADVYRRLASSPPPVNKHTTRTRNVARAKSWAPPIAWDDDTIDDPNAHPDWTGHCGTDRGWWTHRLEQIPVCQPCDTAHEQWKHERAHLTSKERWTELARARAVAANREGNLAADARELLRLDIPIDVIAARLGVTRNHLQQAMLRHPAQQDMEAAA